MREAIRAGVASGLLAACLGSLGGCSSEGGGAKLGGAPVDPNVEARNARGGAVPAPPPAPANPK
jgi:hypothetical protein